MSYKDTERQRIGGTDVTHETHEVPPLAARVSALPEAVQRSLQGGLDEQCLFRFARALKAFEITVNRRLSGNELAEAFALWWQTAKPQLPDGADYDEWRFSFQNSWARVRSPLGANPLEEAIRRAETKPLPPQCEKYPSPKLKSLVAVCYHLQCLTGQGAFFLSARTAARVLGFKQPRQALAMLNGLVGDAVLVQVEKGKPGGRRATRYRFNDAEFNQSSEAPVADSAPPSPHSQPASSGSTSAPPKAASAKPLHPRPAAPITHFQLVEKKKALEELFKPYKDRDLCRLTEAQRTTRKDLREKLAAVTQQLATFGDKPSA